jgi:DNA-binding CsgD family transcriptional regulator
VSWPLTGRPAELRAINAALSAPDVAGVVVCGPSGVGKSRIVREAMSVAVAQGCEGRWAVGTSAGRAVPLGAFNSWAQSGVTDTVQLVRGVIESLTVAPAGTPIVVAVDDVHLLDDLSAFVVQQIVQRAAAKVVLTVRDGESIPTAVHEIWQFGDFVRLDLEPLSLEQSTALLSAVLGGPMDLDTAQRLWELTRGNVLYLRSIVERELADGRLGLCDGDWRWLGDPIVARGLIEVIESRIGDLSPQVGDVLDALSVGEPVGLGALMRITDPAAVEEADARGLIVLESTGGGAQVRVAHPLYGEVRRMRTPPTRLRRLRGLVAAELARADDRDDVRMVVRRATLSLDSDLQPDPDLLARAAHGAVGLADLSLADRLAEAAIRAGAGLNANIVRAHALSWLGRGDEADRVLADVPTVGLTGDEHAKVAFLRASNMLWVLDDPARAIELVADAARSTSVDARCYIDAFHTVYWFATDQPALALRAAQQLPLADLPAVVDAEVAWALAVIYGDAGRTADAVASVEAGRATSERPLDTPQMRFNIADAHVGALLLSGDVREAVEVAERWHEQAADLPGTAHPLGAAIAGRAALGAGRLDVACSLLAQAGAALTASGHASGWGYRYRLPWATAMAGRGRIDEAVAGLNEVDTRRRRFRALDYERSIAGAWLAAGQGAVSEAISAVLAAADRARAKGQFAAEVMCRQTAVQFGDRGCASRLGELEAIVEGPRVTLAARFAAVLGAGDAVGLAEVSEAFERMGDLVAAADAAAHAAIVHRRRDQRGSALGCATRANALAHRCGGVRSPALREAGEDLPLTDREREIAMLLTTGLSNRAIADRLVLSVRTVETHIHRAMSKTGVTTREELAGLLRHRTS